MNDDSSVSKTPGAATQVSDNSTREHQPSECPDVDVDTSLGAIPKRRSPRQLAINKKLDLDRLKSFSSSSCVKISTISSYSSGRSKIEGVSPSVPRVTREGQETCDMLRHLSEMNMWSVVANIFSFLEPQDLCRVSQVNDLLFKNTYFIHLTSNHVPYIQFVTFVTLVTLYSPRNDQSVALISLVYAGLPKLGCLIQFGTNCIIHSMQIKAMFAFLTLLSQTINFYKIIPRYHNCGGYH